MVVGECAGDEILQVGLQSSWLRSFLSFNGGDDFYFEGGFLLACAVGVSVGCLIWNLWIDGDELMSVT